MSMWKIRQDPDTDDFELFVHEHFQPGTTGGNGSGKQAEKSWWSALDVQAILERLSQQRPEGYLRAFGWTQLFHKFFPPGAIISVGAEVDVPHLLSTAEQDFIDFAEHPLILTQRMRDGKEDEDSKRVGYVRPDITVVTIDTSRLRNHYYRALLYWEVKIGSDLNKGFVQVVWALLLGSSLHDTRFAGLATGKRFMRIRMDGSGRIGVDVRQVKALDGNAAQAQIFSDTAKRDGLTINDFLAKAMLKHEYAFPFELILDADVLDEGKGNRLFYDYCVALGNHVFDQFHARPETPPVKLGLDSSHVPLADEMDRAKQTFDPTRKEPAKRIAKANINSRSAKKTKRDDPPGPGSGTGAAGGNGAGSSSGTGGGAGSATGSSTGLGNGGNVAGGSTGFNSGQGTQLSMQGSSSQDGHGRLVHEVARKDAYDTASSGTDPDDSPPTPSVARFANMVPEPVIHDGTRDDDDSPPNSTFRPAPFKRSQSQDKVKQSDSPAVEVSEGQGSVTVWEQKELQRQLETEFDDTDWEVFHKLKHIRVWPYEVLFPQEWYVYCRRGFTC